VPYELRHEIAEIGAEQAGKGDRRPIARIDLGDMGDLHGLAFLDGDADERDTPVSRALMP
jgi:hypothetical protein